MRKTNLRTDQTHSDYITSRSKRKRRGETDCVLCSEPSIREFSYWRIVPNDFPYDVIAETHHMLLPKRHIQEIHDMTDEEREELIELQEGIDGYDSLTKNFPHQQSIPTHFHLHLLTYIVADE